MSKVFRLRDRDGLELKCHGCDEWFSEVYIFANTPKPSENTGRTAVCVRVALRGHRDGVGMRFSNT
jgi:hypothetical protein